MKILITGVAGFLGSHLSQKFADLGHEVIGVDNMISGYKDNVPKNIIYKLTVKSPPRTFSHPFQRRLR